MGTAATNNWFEVDRKGLSKLIERRGKVALVHELISNAWDADGTTSVTVTFTPEENARKVWINVSDDAPDGFADLRHAWTLFAESTRKARSDKRGRFNLGEKLVLALCDEASITTTTAAVMFDQRGRTTSRERRERGSEFCGLARMTRGELAEIKADLKKLIPPAGITVTIDGETLAARTPIATFEATLPTEIADEDGVLKRSTRKCMVSVYDPQEGEVPMLYEMGIPVVETGDKWHVEVHQKVPLNMDRDNVTPVYLRTLRTLVVNHMHAGLTEDDANATFVNDALSDKDIAPEAVTRALDIKYGTKRAVWDPSDLEANMNLVAQGYTVIKGAQLSRAQWDNIRKHDAVNTRPAGQIAPTNKPAGTRIMLPRKEWTRYEVIAVDYVVTIAQELVGAPITVEISNEPAGGYLACYGADVLTFNVARLGHTFFERGVYGGRPSEELNELVIHELGHHYEGNHLDTKYHDALCRLGAKLASLALRRPGLFDLGGM